MRDSEFREWSARAAEWGAEYRARLRDLPVRAQTKPGDIAAQLEAIAPEAGEPMDAIFADFERIVVPGMTQAGIGLQMWQWVCHDRFWLR